MAGVTNPTEGTKDDNSSLYDGSPNFAIIATSPCCSCEQKRIYIKILKTNKDMYQTDKNPLHTCPKSKPLNTEKYRNTQKKKSSMREENYQKLTMRMDAYHQRLDCENDNHVFCSALANCSNSMVFVSQCPTKDIILIF